MEGLKSIMDRKFQEQEGKLAEAKASGDTERFWHIWSFAAERADLEHNDLTDGVNKKMKGRGRVVLEKKKPERQMKKSNI